MPTAEELIVAITSEGVGEVQQDLEGVESSMEETADTAGDSAEELEGFSERFAGAMSAAVTALAVGAAGLLSQVPVLGEVFSGLGAIVSAVAFQMDKVLRPVLSPLTNLFYKVANAIFGADGAKGAFVGIMGVIGSFLALAAGVIATVVTIAAQFVGWASALSGLVSVAGTVVGVIGSIAGAIISLPALIIGAIAAIVAFAAAYITNFKGTRDKTDKIIGEIVAFVKNGFSKLVTKAKEIIGGMYNTLKPKFKAVATKVSEWASGLAEDAKEWGKDLIDEFVAGIKSDIKSVENAAKDIAGVIDEYMPGSPADTGPLSDLDESGPGLVDELASGMRSGVGEVQSAAGDVARGMDARGGGRRSFGGGVGGTQIDGRQLSESTGRYRSDPARRRGN